MATNGSPAKGAAVPPRARLPGQKRRSAWFKDFAKAQKQLDARARLMARLDRLLEEVQRPQQ